jgi:hypothetical protein
MRHYIPKDLNRLPSDDDPPSPCWDTAICPICGKEYEYRIDYKPKTCSKFTCLQEANKRGLFK